MKNGILLIIVLIIFIAVIGVFSVESYTAQPSFCGTKCHIMDKPYTSWQTSKHGKAGKEEVACVDCHYAPGEKMTLHAKFKGLGQLFTYLSSDDKEVRRATHVADISCTTSKCHPLEQFMEKKLDYGKEKKVTFTHKAHYEKIIPGQEMHCTTCHVKASDDKHFEAPAEQCYICHFKHSEFNKGKAACNLCHAIPTTPLQQQKKDAPLNPDEKVITHQSLEKAGVSCQSCHYQLIIGDASLIPGGCDNCHSNAEILKKDDDMKLMHAEHVAKQKAACFDCHQKIQHKEIEFLEPARLACRSCHPDHHSYQQQLLVGARRGDVPATPSLMFAAKTNCMGCHQEEKKLRGETVVRGAAKTCVDCHGPDHDKMLADWEKEVQGEVAFCKETEQRVKDLLEKARNQLSAEQISEFEALMEKGRKSLDIVEFGNGIHNKKYSIMLIDDALTSFETVLDEVEPLVAESETAESETEQ